MNCEPPNPLTLDEQQVLYIFTGLTPEELDKQLAQLSTVEVLAESVNHPKAARELGLLG